MRIGRHGRLKAIIDIRNPQCHGCSFYQSSKHICIMGRGNPMAQIFAVGEAPGSAEGGMGKPFMGPAGQLLDRALIELKIQDQVYISNVVRCRPPKNQKPDFIEVSACLHYLLKELTIIHPEVIILMGRTAMDTFGISQRDKPAFCDIGIGIQAWVVGSWHPAYCLRMGEQSNARAQLLSTFRCAKQRIDSANGEE